MAGLLIVLGGMLIVFSPVIILLIGGLVGAAQERRHFEDLARREQALAQSGLSVTGLRTPPAGMEVGRATLVTGAVVIASDHFKTFCAKWRKIFGGEFKALARMQERARREAILRMLESARTQGATAVCNVRLETSTIAGKEQGKISGCELIAYGTALIPPSTRSPG